MSGTQTEPTSLLTKQNAPKGTIAKVKDMLYVVDAFNIARRLKKYVPGDHFDQEGVPGFPKMPKRPNHTGSKYFHSYRKSIHGGKKWQPKTKDEEE